MTKGSEIPLRVTRDQDLAEEWELVLIAQGLSPSVRRTREGMVLGVPEEEVARALASLSAYEKENPPRLEEAYEPVGPAGWLVGLAGAGMLLLFYSATVLWNTSLPWLERGSADADRMLLGELWRAVTALTLHADLLHALTNAVALVLFLAAVSSTLGPGLACALVLVAGAGGNLANALLYGSPHVSVGASTSIFGAIGMLGSLGVARLRRRAAPGRRAWLPVAAAIALLAMLGTAGQRVDVWAHLFGLLIGGVLGILIAFVAPRPPGPGLQWAFGSAALAVLVGCWALALR